MKTPIKNANIQKINVVIIIGFILLNKGRGISSFLITFKKNTTQTNNPKIIAIDPNVACNK